MTVPLTLTLTSPRRGWRPCLLATLCLLLVTTASVAAELVAVDDHLDVTTAEQLVVTSDWLRANDSFPRLVKTRIVEAPRYGTLLPVEGGYVYHQVDGPFLGVDTFTYELVDVDSTSAPARVTLRLVLDRQPIAGRWPTPSCNDRACPAPSCGYGEDGEIGWYQRSTQTFELCDWHGDIELVDCQRLVVPFAVEAGGMPLVIDWDDDGWDEPALHDPATGLVYLLEDSGAPCAGEADGRCLDLAGAWDLEPSLGPASRHVMPLANRWSFPSSTGETRDALAVYDSVSGKVYLGFDGEHFQQVRDFAHGLGPLATTGDWLAGGNETVGLWSQDSATFSHLAGRCGFGIVTFTPELSADFLSLVWPFALPRDGCAPADLGFYNPCRNQIIFRSPGESDDDHASTYVNVPTDPEGYPGSWLDCQAGRP